MGLFNILDFFRLKAENDGFEINEPFGTDNYVFLHFVNPVEIFIDGRWIRTAPNMCALFTPKTPYRYRANSIEMFHNWILFHPIDSDAFSILNDFPCNQIMYTSKGSIITKIMEDVQWSFNHDDEPQPIMSTLIEKIFRLVSNEYVEERKSSDDSRMRFDELRSRIWESPKEWNVKRMSKEVHLSTSRFSIKYKDYFGIAPGSDLNKASMAVAEKLLANTNMSIGEIAEECGYNNVSFFVKKFKEVTKMTPSTYRRKLADSSIRKNYG